MIKRTIVFDFDKTLTYHDTLFGFLNLAASKNVLYPIKIVVYFIAMVLSSLKLITNSSLKSLGIRLFLKGKSFDEISDISEKYVSQIECNDLYKEYNFETTDNIYIVSASFYAYLKPLFPDNVVIYASRLEFQNKHVFGLKDNCYEERKLQVLLEKGISHIDVLYTDSISDYPLVQISDKTVLVRKNKRINCSSNEEFLEQF